MIIALSAADAAKTFDFISSSFLRLFFKKIGLSSYEFYFGSIVYFHFVFFPSLPRMIRIRTWRPR